MKKPLFKKSFYYDFQVVNDHLAVLYLTEFTAYWQDKEYNFKRFSYADFFYSAQQFNRLYPDVTVLIDVSSKSVDLLCSLPAHQYAYIKFFMGCKIQYLDEKDETIKRIAGI